MPPIITKLALKDRKSPPTSERRGRIRRGPSIPAEHCNVIPNGENSSIYGERNNQQPEDQGRYDKRREKGIVISPKNVVFSPYSDDNTPVHKPYCLFPSHRPLRKDVKRDNNNRSPSKPEDSPHEVNRTPREHNPVTPTDILNTPDPSHLDRASHNLEYRSGSMEKNGDTSQSKETHLSQQNDTNSFGQIPNKLILDNITSYGNRAIECTDHRKKLFFTLKTVIDTQPVDFIKLASALRSIEETYPLPFRSKFTNLQCDTANFSNDEIQCIEMSQKTLIDLQHVALATMELQNALCTGNRSIEMMVRAIRTANKTMMLVNVCEYRNKCNQSVEIADTMLEMLSKIPLLITNDSDYISLKRRRELLRSFCPSDLMVIHLPNRVWSAKLTVTYHQVITNLTKCIEMELAELNKTIQNNQITKQTSISAERQSSRSEMHIDKVSNSVGSSLNKKEKSGNISAVPSLATTEKRHLQTSAESSKDDTTGQGRIVVEENLSRHSSRYKHAEQGLAVDQFMLEASTQLRFKIHFDSQIRLLAMDSQNGAPQTPPSRQQRNNVISYFDGMKRPHEVTSLVHQYQPPSFDRVFDKIYCFCTQKGQEKMHVPVTRTSVNFRIRYQDTEGDFITLISEDDWKLLLDDYYRAAYTKTKGIMNHLAPMELYCDIPAIPHSRDSMLTGDQSLTVWSGSPTAGSRAIASPGGGRLRNLRLPLFTRNFHPPTPKSTTPLKGKDTNVSRGFLQNDLQPFKIKNVTVPLSAKGAPIADVMDERKTTLLDNVSTDKITVLSPINPNDRNVNICSSRRSKGAWDEQSGYDICTIRSEEAKYPTTSSLSNQDATMYSQVPLQDAESNKWQEAHGEYDLHTMVSIETTELQEWAKNTMSEAFKVQKSLEKIGSNRLKLTKPEGRSGDMIRK